MAGIREVQRKNGSAWEVRWTDGGRDVQMTCATLKEAEREKLRIEDELDAGRSTLWRVEKRTVAQVVEACIKAGEVELKARTIDGQRAILRNHIAPALGQRRIGSLRARDVEKWVAKLAEKLSPGTVRVIYNVLNKAAKYAIRHEWLVVNPCSGVALPKDRSEVVDDRHFLTPLQVAALAEALSEKQEWFGLLVRMAAFTGLRAGELAALRVGDVNLLRGEVQVRRTVRRGKGEWLYTSPKSKKSVRDVPLPGALRAELEAWLAAHPNRHDPDARLWPGLRSAGRNGAATDWDRVLDMNNWCGRYFRPLVRSGVAGLPTGLRWHDLRHTYASIMAAAPGITVYDISKWLGHSSISVTEKVYIHLFRTDYSDKMSAVDAFLSGAGQSLGQSGSVTALRLSAAAR
ncbi:tyrosine-type recombinase/integrase [Kitasatospora sp. NPDC051914]|uniref:tyrosine-type recombinase/integrase n=1 Tax=Kitasatospora sp. NPDC051914 TaxID=3154945 RepID=UPI0034229D93